MPPGFDLTLAREQAAEHRDDERRYKRKHDKIETKERIEEIAGPKPVGREGMLEKKKLKRESDRDFRERGDEGLEIDESTLMGGGDSFKAQYGYAFSFVLINFWYMLLELPGEIWPNESISRKTKKRTVRELLHLKRKKR
jgi:hypothetical protein